MNILWSIENPRRYFFHTLRKFTHTSGLATKPDLCTWRQTQTFYGKYNHCRSRNDLSTIVPTKIQEISFSLKILVGFRETFVFPQKCESVKFHFDWVKFPGIFKNIFLFDKKPLKTINFTNSDWRSRTDLSMERVVFGQIRKYSWKSPEI